MRKESHAAILCALNFKYPNLPMSEIQLTKSFYFVNRPKPTIDNK